MNRLPTPEPGTPSGRCPACRTPLNSASVGEDLSLPGISTGEARYARWDEIDLDQAVFTVPANRTKKSGRPQRIPLNGPALVVLDDAWERTGGVGLVFPSATGQSISPGCPRRWFCRCVAGVRNIKKRRDPLGSQTDGIPAGNARPFREGARQ